MVNIAVHVTPEEREELALSDAMTTLLTLGDAFQLWLVAPSPALARPHAAAIASGYREALQPLEGRLEEAVRLVGGRRLRRGRGLAAHYGRTLGGLRAAEGHGRAYLRDVARLRDRTRPDEDRERAATWLWLDHGWSPVHPRRWRALREALDERPAGRGRDRDEELKSAIRAALFEVAADLRPGWERDAEATWEGVRAGLERRLPEAVLGEDWRRGEVPSSEGGEATRSAHRRTVALEHRARQFAGIEVAQTEKGVEEPLTEPPDDAVIMAFLERAIRSERERAVVRLIAQHGATPTEARRLAGLSQSDFRAFQARAQKVRNSS